jgi:hypothetical protein
MSADEAANLDEVEVFASGGGRTLESEQPGAPWQPKGGETYVQSMYYEVSQESIAGGLERPSSAAVELAKFIIEAKVNSADESLSILPDDEKFDEVLVSHLMSMHAAKEHS